MNKMMYFTIPDSPSQTALNIKLLALIQNRPELFYDDFKIASAYGCPDGCLWNGGGISIGSRSNKEIHLTMRKYKEFGAQYWLTFTNRLLRPEHMADTYGNAIARIASEYEAGALVSNDVMEEHIRRYYPKLRIIQSICRCAYNIEDINKLSSRDLTVIPIRHNNEFDGSLRQLTHPENIEVLTNEACIENCPYNRTHYESFNRYMLRESDTYHTCRFPQENRPEMLKFRKHYVPRELFPEYEKLGINHMKISGRNSGLGLIPTYLEMFVKPQWRELVELKLARLDRDDWDWTKDDDFLRPTIHDRIDL